MLLNVAKVMSLVSIFIYLLMKQKDQERDRVTERMCELQAEVESVE